LQTSRLKIFGVDLFLKTITQDHLKNGVSSIYRGDYMYILAVGTAYLNGFHRPTPQTSSMFAL